MAEELLCLRAALTPARWREFCRGEFQELPALLGQHGYLGLLEEWEHTLPSVAGMLAASRLFDGEITETRGLLPQASILALGSDRPPANGSFDLIYSAERLNLCCDEEALIWLEDAARLLRPGGRLIAANLTPGGRDAAYLDARWNLRPFYRDEHSLAHLASSLYDERLRGHAVFRDDTGAMAFLEIQAA
jgi:SAM-dependent methyltransferase